MLISLLQEDQIKFCSGHSQQNVDGVNTLSQLLCIAYLRLTMAVVQILFLNIPIQGPYRCSVSELRIENTFQYLCRGW